MNKDKNPNKKPTSKTLNEVLQTDVGEELMNVVSKPGELTYTTINNFFTFLGSCSILVSRAIGFILRGKISIKNTIAQMSIIGIDSIPIVLITIAFSGAVLALYMAQILVRWGIGSYTGAIVGISIAREIAPVLTAVVVAARAGSAIAAEIGSMKVTEQIDALRALAVSPIEYLVVPRLLGGIITLPILCMFAMITGIAGAYVVATINGVAGGGFISTLKSQIELYDIFMGLVKTLFFGAVIVIVGAQQGLNTEGGAEGVGKSTTNAVVISVVAIYILNFFLAYIMFGGETAFL
ncbi:MAG: ABC transporter permease [Armatimonadota bacterium]